MGLPEWFSCLSSTSPVPGSCSFPVVERFGFLILRRVSSHSDQTVRAGLDMTAQPSMLLVVAGCNYHQLAVTQLTV